MEEFPLTRAEALDIGAKWSDYIPPVPEAKGSVFAKDIFDDVQTAAEQVFGSVILCEETARSFKLIPQEVEFLRKMNLFVPRKHPEIRERDRRRRRRGRKMYLKNCASCQREIPSVFPTTDKGLDYCQECYEKAVY